MFGLWRDGVKGFPSWDSVVNVNTYMSRLRVVTRVFVTWVATTLTSRSGYEEIQGNTGTYLARGVGNSMKADRSGSEKTRLVVRSITPSPMASPIVFSVTHALKIQRSCNRFLIATPA